MKTKDEWDELKCEFSDYVEPGDEVDEAIWDYFMGVVPPVYMGPKGFLMGEPVKFGEKHEELYMHFCAINKRMLYIGLESIKGVHFFDRDRWRTIG